MRYLPFLRKNKIKVVDISIWLCYNSYEDQTQGVSCAADVLREQDGNGFDAVLQCILQKPGSRGIRISQCMTHG